MKLFSLRAVAALVLLLGVVSMGASPEPLIVSQKVKPINNIADLPTHMPALLPNQLTGDWVKPEMEGEYGEPDNSHPYTALKTDVNNGVLFLPQKDPKNTHGHPQFAPPHTLRFGKYGLSPLQQEQQLDEETKLSLEEHTGEGRYDDLTPLKHKLEIASDDERADRAAERELSNRLSSLSNAEAARHAAREEEGEWMLSRRRDQYEERARLHRELADRREELDENYERVAPRVCQGNCATGARGSLKVHQDLLDDHKHDIDERELSRQQNQETDNDEYSHLPSAEEKGGETESPPLRPPPRRKGLDAGDEQVEEADRQEKDEELEPSHKRQLEQQLEEQAQQDNSDQVRERDTAEEPKQLTHNRRQKRRQEEEEDQESEELNQQDSEGEEPQMQEQEQEKQQQRQQQLEQQTQQIERLQQEDAIESEGREDSPIKRRHRRQSRGD